MLTLFVLTCVDTFLGNKSSYEAITSCQKKDVPKLFQFFLKKLGRKLSKGGTEFVQTCDSFCMPGSYARIIPGLFSLFFRVELLGYVVDVGIW